MTIDMKAIEERVTEGRTLRRIDMLALIAEIKRLQYEYDIISEASTALHGAWESQNKEIKRLQTELDRCTSGNGTYISIESHNHLIKKAEQTARDARNELCLKCGKYHEAHNGACDGCRWEGK